MRRFYRLIKQSSRIIPRLPVPTYQIPPNRTPTIPTHDPQSVESGGQREKGISRNLTTEFGDASKHQTNYEGDVWPDAGPYDWHVCSSPELLRW